MNPREKMEARLAELRSESRRCVEQRGALIDKASDEKRGLTEAEQTAYDGFTATRKAAEEQIPAVEARLAELIEDEQRSDAASRTTVLVGAAGEQRTSATQVVDPPMYVRGGGNGKSYFIDLYRAQCQQDVDARDNLRRHALAAAAEQRALGNTGAVGGSGGEFAPPAWLINDYLALARAGRVTANLFKHAPMPMGVSSINLPKILTGTTTALQTTQNTALSQTDLTTSFVSTGIATVGGKELVAQQLLDQSGIDFDTVITTDLAAAYAANIGSLAFIGTGTGTGTGAVINGLMNAVVPAGNQIAYTGTASAATFYSKCAGAIASFATLRFAEPTAWVMHPRRWYWLVAQVDSQGRPLVVPNGPAFNQMATTDARAEVQGYAGTFLGLPVFIDPNVPTNIGTGTNQDRVFLLRVEDLWIFESAPRAEVFTQTYADSVGVLFRLYAYAATILNRYPASIAYVDGAALTPPAF